MFLRSLAILFLLIPPLASQAGSIFSYEIPTLSDADVEQAQVVVENLDALKAEISDFYLQIEKISKKRPIQISEVDAYAAHLEEYLTLRRSVVSHLKPYEILVNNRTRLEVNSKRQTLIEERPENQESGPPIPTYYIRLNPNDKVGRELIRVVKVSLALSLSLFDVYAEMIDPMMQNEKLRRLLEVDHEASLDRLKMVQTSFVNHIDRFPLRNLVKFFVKIKQKAPKQINSLTDSWFYDSILHSNSYKVIINGDFNYFSNVAKQPILAIRDSMSKTIKKITFEASEIFGNFVGRFQSRHGKLFDMSLEERKKLKSTLKPLDILIERTPFRLTDKLIPGYYGHVAMWLGTEEELIELGIWNHPLIIPHQKAIQSGHSLLESVRIPGVRLSTLDDFLDIDDLLILRRRAMDPNLMNDYLLSAIDLIGRPYDFNFDVETSNEIICSEVVYHTFNDMYWPADKTLGRFSVSPDQVAYRALKINKGRDFEIVEMIRDGNSVPEENRHSQLKYNLANP